MKINEVANIPDLDDVDLVDDLKFYMENDPQFYRRILYPIISQMKTQVKNGQRCKDNLFRDCVDKAALLYCKKFNIPDNPKSVFTDVDRDSLARQIFGQERDRINQGVYDKDDQ
jgi:hypothetical protein